jgi:hypothetical protein
MHKERRTTQSSTSKVKLVLLIDNNTHCSCVREITSHQLSTPENEAQRAAERHQK